MDKTFDVRSSDAWLHENRHLRMDANHASFPDVRRKFHLARYEFARTYCAGKRVLDGACGTGYGSALVGEVASSVIGIDCDKGSVDYANAKYGNDKVSFCRSFVEMTPFEESSFDVVLSFETVEHTLCPAAHMMEIVRLLNPQHGIAVLSIPNKWGLTDHHFLDFDFPMLKALTDRYFSSVDFFYQNPDTHPQFPGIGPFTPSTLCPAQCVVAVCGSPHKEQVVEDRYNFIMNEVYDIAFSRHAEYLTLAYKQNTGLLKRLKYKLQSLVTR